MTMNRIALRTLQFAFLITTSSLAFLFSNPSRPSRPSRHVDRTSLFGLAEWRDNLKDEQESRGKPLLLLPFAADKALVQGQSKDIRLKEGRFYDLFQDSIDDYESIVGMVLMGDDGLLQDMPLCEIHDFDVEAGFRGKVTVSVTLRAVGRAKIEQFTQMKPIMMGRCTELVDGENVNVSLANELAKGIESTIKNTNLQKSYDDAFRLALETDVQGHDKTTGNTMPEGRQRSISELTATSWAVLACITDKSCLYKAIATTDLTERLELGLKALLDAKFQASAIPNKRDGDVGFE